MENTLQARKEKETNADRDMQADREEKWLAIESPLILYV